jgi:hypothetical protein
VIESKPEAVCKCRGSAVRLLVAWQLAMQLQNSTCDVDVGCVPSAAKRLPTVGQRHLLRLDLFTVMVLGTFWSSSLLTPCGCHVQG